MVKAIEARDPYTLAIHLRVSEMSRPSPSNSACQPGKSRKLKLQRFLHDVGKIHEEFAPLLRKEGASPTKKLH